LNRLFVDLKKVAFSVGQETEKLLQSAVQQLELSLFTIHPNLIFGCSRGRKCVPSALQPPEKSLY